MSDPFKTQRDLLAFFNEAGGAEALRTIRDTDPARFAALAAKHNIIIPTRMADLERAVIDACIAYRSASNREHRNDHPDWRVLLPLADKWGEAVDALLRARGEK